MVNCPYCQSEQSKVLDSRSTEKGRSIRRRRECVSCQRRFTTYERVESTPLMVVKRDGRREQFQRDKLLEGVMTACEKRPISADQIRQIIDDIEYELSIKAGSEASSQIIGELVMERLKDLDDVAYVRFASVYRRFKDLDAFEQEVTRLRQQDPETERGDLE